jgi:hypothetical protein
MRWRRPQLRILTDCDLPKAHKDAAPAPEGCIAQFAARAGGQKSEEATYVLYGGFTLRESPTPFGFGCSPFVFLHALLIPFQRDILRGG